MKALWSKVFDPYQWWYPWLILAIMCTVVVSFGAGFMWVVDSGNAPAFFYQDIGPTATATPTEVCSGNTN